MTDRHGVNKAIDSQIDRHDRMRDSLNERRSDRQTERDKLTDRRNAKMTKDKMTDRWISLQVNLDGGKELWTGFFSSAHTSTNPTSHCSTLTVSRDLP